MNATQMIRLTVMWLLIAASSGCNSQSPKEAQTERASASAPAADTTPKAHNLTIYGYNYTNTGIGSFEVNGQGGGNLEVSVSDSGGGKSACCISMYSPMTKPQTIKIKWTRDLETWCEQEVQLQPPIPNDAKTFEVHFYPDGRIELAVTGNLFGRMYSPPRLVLPRDSRAGRFEDAKLNINNDTKFSRCKLGYH